MISIKGLDKAAVLAALYNASHPLRMGFLHYDPKPMTIEEAREMIGAGDDTTQAFGKFVHGDRQLYFDYLKGRVMKVDLSGDELDPRLYDRDNGQGAAARAIAALTADSDINPQESQQAHKEGTLDAAADVKVNLNEESRLEENGGVAVLTLGTADVADVLGPAVDKAIEDK